MCAYSVLDRYGTLYTVSRPPLSDDVLLWYCLESVWHTVLQ